MGDAHDLVVEEMALRLALHGQNRQLAQVEFHGLSQVVDHSALEKTGDPSPHVGVVRAERVLVGRKKPVLQQLQKPIAEIDV